MRGDLIFGWAGRSWGREMGRGMGMGAGVDIDMDIGMGMGIGIASILGV